MSTDNDREELVRDLRTAADIAGRLSVVVDPTELPTNTGDRVAEAERRLARAATLVGQLLTVVAPGWTASESAEPESEPEPEQEDPAGQPVQCPCCGNTGRMVGPDQYVCPENGDDWETDPITLSEARRMAADVAAVKADVRARRAAGLLYSDKEEL